MKVLSSIDLEIPNSHDTSYENILREAMAIAIVLSEKHNWNNVYVVHDCVIKSDLKPNIKTYCYSIVGSNN